MKTAGTAVSSLLRPYYTAEARYPRIELGKMRNQKLYVGQLLHLPPKERAQTLFYSVHMPAWTAQEVAPQHLHVSVLRDPVARTISHLRHIARGLNVDSLEEIYDDPLWQSRLNNYQTRLFSMRSADHYQRRSAWDAAIAKAIAGGAKSTTPRETETQPQPGSPNESGMQREMYTGMFEPDPQTQADLSAAIAMVDSFDVVGVTEHLDLLVTQLSHITATKLDAIPRVNAATDQHQACAALRERIRRDNTFDTLLYDYVVERVMLAN